MWSERKLLARWGDVLLFALSILVFSICTLYAYFLARQAKPGFQLHALTWEVVTVHLVRPPERTLEAWLHEGDQILRIGTVGRELRYDRTVPPFRDVTAEIAPGGSGYVPVEVLRDDQRLVIQWPRPTDGFPGISPVLAALLLPLLFWLAGTVVIIFFRPRDRRWLVLVLFLYDTALWNITGILSHSKVAYSSVLFHVFIWLFMPLCIHLHLVLPDAPFKKLGRIVPGLYVVAFVFIVLDFFYKAGNANYLWTTLLAIIVSLVLLARRWFIPSDPATKVANRLMLFGVGLGLGFGWGIAVLFELLDSPSRGATGVRPYIPLVIVPLWPLSYIYALYKHNLGAIELRANRWLGVYGFFALYVGSYLLVFSLLSRWDLAVREPVAYSLLVSLGFAALAPRMQQHFQLYIDRHVFGIKYTPGEIMGNFAEKIPAAFNREVLAKIIVDDVLPTLMVRQSALYFFDENGLESIYEQGLSGESPVKRSELERFVAGSWSGRVVLNRGLHAWIRLAVPLSIEEKVVGVWGFGRRDPDDNYPKSDIHLLSNLANQIAPVLEHVRLVELARQEVEENRRLQQQLVQSQKMEAIGRLSAGVAHDFNNFLSVILGYCDLLIARHSKEYNLRKNLTAIKDAGTRAATLTRQLLAFSRQQVMESKILDFNSVVLEMAQILERLAGEDVEVHLRLANDLQEVKVDPHQMGQVLINLTVNARDAMPEGGRLILETTMSRVDDETEGLSDDLSPGTYVLLSVTDTGRGIDPALHSRVFEPFFTTKEVGKGTGLGLSMVYGVIRQSHGAIAVESTPQRGTTFRIYLPVANRAEVEASQVISRPPGLSLRGSETILLVEDEESVRQVASKILRSKGYNVLQAEGGAQGLELFESYDGKVDLLLTDVVMPQMKGPELAEQLLLRKPKLKVIYMSGYNEEALPEHQVSSLGSLLIQKPFSPQTLAYRVREALDGENETVTH